MKGKKKDPEFLSQFIVECVQSGKILPDQILDHAQREINQIDQQILAIEKLKTRRSKLMDVVFHFRQTIDANVGKPK